MRRLRDSLEKLFRLCGVDEERVEIKMPPKVITILESLFKDNSLCTFLDSLDSQAVLAARELSNRQLDLWCGKETENRLEEAQEKLAGMEDRLEEMEKKLKETEEELAHSMEQRNGDREKYEGEMEKLRQEAEGKVDAAEKENEENIRNMIDLRNSLFMRRDWLKENKPEETFACKLVENQLQETANLLNKAGVEIQEDTGIFDCRRQMAVGTRSTDDPALDNNVAEVFRPGYIYKGKPLKVQEVFVYACER